MFRIVPLTLFLFLLWGRASEAQTSYDANWIWFDAGDPAVSAPAGKVWFHREVRSDEPSTGLARIICDDRFTLWVNGERVGAGSGLKVFRFNLNGLVGRGPNVIAIEAENTDGKAGLYVDGEVRGQRGTPYSFDSGPGWHATTKAPEGDAWKQPRFNLAGWTPVKVIGKHDDSPWKSLELKESYLDRFDVAEGFELERIAEPQLVGSLVAFTWGNRGRLIASRERGPILVLTDEDGDGKYDKATEYCKEVTNCQGLCMVSDDLYAVGNGPKGTGIYRLPDQNHDDVADEIIPIASHKGGMGEHGPHAVVLGPDGWLYHNMGNHAWITQTPEATTPVRDYEEGDLLRPKFEDARGHAVGILAPGGTIWRFTPDGQKWWCETNGFRNEYDIAFNARGDLFSFDSDMEWDVAAPWYRPVRVNHCIPGAEFGWRSGAAKWPAYYFDSLPGTVDIGRGSPTGVVFYDHNQFPEKYRGSLLACDWSMGRIIAVHMQPEGGTYTGTWENLVVGNPLNVSDIEVDRDGSVVFSTGGRGTEGGLYRVKHRSAKHEPATAKSVDDVLNLPQLQSAWARELAATVKASAGKDWEKELLSTPASRTPHQKLQALTLLNQLGPSPESKTLLALSQDQSPEVRAFATFLLGYHSGDDVGEGLTARLIDPNATVRRRACEAFVRSGVDAPPGQLALMLGDDDRHVRFAARLAFERIPVADKDVVLSSRNPSVVTHGLLSLHRQHAIDPDQVQKIAAGLLGGSHGTLDEQQTLDALRMVELSFLAGGRSEHLGNISEHLLKTFPSGKVAYDAEAARLLAVIGPYDAAAKIVAAMEQSKSNEQQLHYALCLRYVKVGWNLDLQRRLLNWYETTREWEGGNSLIPYIANIVGGSIRGFAPDARRKLLADWRQRPFASGLLITSSAPSEIDDYETAIGAILNDTGEQSQAGRDELISLAINSLGKSPSSESRNMLRKLYEQNPDRREQLARAIAANPTPEDWPQLVRTLQFADATTLQLCLGALQKIDRSPEKPEEFRSAILAGLKLGQQGGQAAVNVLAKWTNSQHGAGKDIPKAVAHYQTWYAQKFPNAPAAELPADDLQQAKYTFQQLFDYLEKDPVGSRGDAVRGKLVFEKAKCFKCHRFLNQGETIGPDLTSVRRRFQRKEIIESMVYPSLVISDQFRMVTVVTVDGLVHNGMPIPGVSNPQNLVLLLPDATKLEIPRNKIDEEVPSKTSVMPVGLLKDLTLEEIADLFAFLETSKDNELTPREPNARAAAN